MLCSVLLPTTQSMADPIDLTADLPPSRTTIDLTADSPPHSPPQTPGTTPSTPPRRTHTVTTHADRVRVKILHKIGWNLTQIARELGLTRAQARYARDNPEKPSTAKRGPPGAVSKEEAERVYQWIKDGGEPTRRMPLWQVCSILKLPYSDVALAKGFRAAGIERRLLMLEGPSAVQSAPAGNSPVSHGVLGVTNRTGLVNRPEMLDARCDSEMRHPDEG